MLPPSPLARRNATQPIAAVALGGHHAFEDCNAQWPDTFSGALQYGPGPVAKKGFLLQYTARTASRAEHRSHGKRFFGTATACPGRGRPRCRKPDRPGGNARP
ncbi:MAG: hypothetical protein U1E05_11430, partial [Patescibacteria group bacterium]|nr:hypothetical protein [Patescibacteria group bacterium]